MATASQRLDGLSEVAELEQIPLPYKTLYHTLVLSDDMPIDLLRERHHSSSQQLLTWIQAALGLLDTVTESQQYQGRDEEEDEELEIEIQDVVSGIGHYVPTIQSSIEILLQLEDFIAQRSSSSASDSEDEHQETPLSPEIEATMEQWSRLREIISDLGTSAREHQRLRDGIQGVRNISEQLRMASGIFDKCLGDIAMDRQRTRELALAEEAASRNGSSNSLSSDEGVALLRARARSSGVDSNDMLELDSRLGLLSLQIDTLQKSYPECTRSGKALKAKGRSSQQQESGSIAEKKYVMHKLYRELLKDWHNLRTRKDQLWRDLEECDRWRTRIEKMATQIEAMLEPVEIFHKMCVNLLATLDGQQSVEELTSGISQQSMTIVTRDIAQSKSLTRNNSFMDSGNAVDLETLWAALQELDEKQTTVAPAIENMFWVQEGEIQHRSKAAAMSPTTPATANSDTNQLRASASSPPSPAMDHSPLYPSLTMLERQKCLKNRWSNLKTSLDAVGSKLHGHHTLLKEKANEALIKKEEAEDKTLVGSGNSVDGGDWASTMGSPTLRRSSTEGPHKSPLTSPNWNASNRFLRGKMVSSISMDSSTVKKFMLVKSDKPNWSKPRPWCPSVNVASPGLPGFPMQTSQWGYFIVSTSQSEDNFGAIIATPAPLPLRSPTPAQVKPAPPKIERPPFSPGGNRRYTAFNKPLPSRPPMHSRSISVAGGDFKNGALNPMSTTYGDPIDWAKTLRRSTSFSTTKQNSNGKGGRSNVNTPAGPHSNKLKRAASAGPGRPNQQNMLLNPTARRNSSVSQQSPPGPWGGNRNNNQGLSVINSRRPSLSSSEDGTVMGHPAASNHRNDRRGGKTLQKNGPGAGSLASLTDSSSSLDSMMSSSNDSFVELERYGSSLSSSIGARSPSPYAPMFGSSFAAARSSAALRSALLAGMSSTSSASLRYSSSSLSGNESAVQKEKTHQQQIKKLGTTSASSWMSMNMNMNTGNILSALSFTVPTYNFDEDFKKLGSMEESIAAM
ncbi:hypothetical protein BC939DRAFT_508390 [Gamsiella multidivaricata]|uniref:uncharacterized protein n=1 Tax=Gamsiella multidivaricata TaxID=101098 RepID=UPI00221E44FF|nr:uncharacterized protein BC939DRAFT_508390 [Gamsiella multidivaricata]KAG0355174.1 hypothetical protein BGZ54_001263 [Gamsiella multidivaricata]KAI7816356.1 hypothetical protein BC939DRAFT_508390 [Gamsiella multidivaricata]